MRRPIFSKNLENDVRLVWRWLTHCLVVLVACSAPLWAQTPATSLSDLPARVEKSDRIEVTLRDGSIVKGRFDAVAGSSLRIRSSRQMQDLSGNSIAGIKRQVTDSKWNGTLIGLAVGVGTAIFATSAVCGSNDPECSAAAAAIFLPTCAGGGAGLGALLDGLTHRYDWVYVSTTAGGPRWHLSPVVSNHKKGVLLTVSF